MTYSKIHKRFSERLNEPEALKNPEKYLGPNYQDVLNFWIYIDTLSDLEKREISDRYWALDNLNYKVRESASIAAINAAAKVVSWKFSNNAWWAPYDGTRGKEVFARATVELIGSHKLLDQNKILTFLPLCIKS